MQRLYIWVGNTKTSVYFETINKAPGGKEAPLAVPGSGIMFKFEQILLKDNYSRTAGRRMGEALLSKLGQRPDACWLFCSPKDHLDDLLKGICDAVGKNLIGCSTSGEIFDSGYGSGAAVLGGAVSDQIEFQLAHADRIGKDSEGAGRRLSERLNRSADYLQIFSDGITGNGSAVLRGISSVFGDRILISGGTAGDLGKFQKTWQFFGDQVMSDAVVGIGFTGRFRAGVGVESGWSPIGLPKKATRSEGNTLYELNGEPALHVYERFLGKHAEKLPEVGVEYPLAILETDAGSRQFHLLRATMSVDRETGAVGFAGDIPEGSMVCLTCGDKSAILDAASKASQNAVSELGGSTPVLIFCFSCMARKIILGRRIGEEIQNVCREVRADIPIMGFYTYGEYATIRRGGPAYLHNETIAVTIIGI